MQDYETWSSSPSCELLRSMDVPIAKYLTIRLPLPAKRIMAQMRLANQQTCNSSFMNQTGKLDHQQICQICKLTQNETIAHICTTIRFTSRTEFTT